MRNLPEVNTRDLPLWREDKKQCGGYLNKKASQTSALNKGKWQKRWFSINVMGIAEDENYKLQYFHSAEDKQPRQTHELAGASIKIAGDTSFAITFSDGTSLSLSADSIDQMREWVTTLENIITIGNMRDRMMEKNPAGHGGGVESDEDDNEDAVDELEGVVKSKKKKGHRGDGHLIRIHDKEWPTLRLDFDCATIPPGTIDRHRFIEMFCNDVANALGIEVELVEVISIKPAPGMDWLSLVEFDINLWSADLGEEEEDGNESQQPQRRIEIRSKLLEMLHDMLIDPSSVLYNGFITSKVDPSFSANLVENTIEKEEIEQHEIFSNDVDIMRIMNKYKDIHTSEEFHDETTFKITIYFESRIAKVVVPNPAVLTKRYCALWPFEVKQALGFVGTMQELWIEPLELVPRDTTMKSHARAIPFAASVRLGGQKIINAVHLTADGHYDLKCDDKRDDALNSLSKEEMDHIKETFQKCDLDGDGGISKKEMEEIVRTRTQERRALIEKKFKKYVAENDLSSDEIASAELNKSRFLQQIHESQTRLLKMFEAADLNGDGVISFTEFILAEAWWLRCTINPERAHLF